jgi:hypothetical protein
MPRRQVSGCPIFRGRTVAIRLAVGGAGSGGSIAILED